MPNVQHARSTAQFRDGDMYVGIAKVVHASNYAGRPLLNVRFPAELATFRAWLPCLFGTAITMQLPRAYPPQLSRLKFAPS